MCASENEKPLDFQSIMFALQSYWASQGCLIWQPYYSQVGAGTMNPATFLRVLGPEPWKVAYVEPSVRPDDGRYGINPNRLQMHYQFQVILKPDPGNPQELYLDSLRAIGIDPHQHDIRFVEDNWESPALSAWGLGWEVWLDGQETMLPAVEYLLLRYLAGRPEEIISRVELFDAVWGERGDRCAPDRNLRLCLEKPSSAPGAVDPPSGSPGTPPCVRPCAHVGRWISRGPTREVAPASAGYRSDATSVRHPLTQGREPGRCRLIGFVFPRPSRPDERQWLQPLPD